MNVLKLMTKEVKTCRPDQMAEQAARLMWENDCGCVPIVDDANRVVGVVTDRDICMAAYTQNRSLREIPVSSAMSSEVFSVHPEEDLEAAEMIMKERQVHRIPVVDAEDVLVGILSLNDLANAAARPRGLPKSKSEVTHEEIAHTLEAISAHRVPQMASS